MSRALVILLIISSTVGLTQRFPLFVNYKLDEHVEPDIHEVEDARYYYSKYFLAIEYEFEQQTDNFYKFRTEHYRVKLLTNASIEEFNKVYIPTENVYELKNMRARIIRKDTILEVPPQIEEFQSQDESMRHYYFPISGLELGDELEIFYTLKMESAFDGDQFQLQGEIPIYDMDFVFIAPNDSYFDFQSWNGLPEPKKVDTILQKNQWSFHLDSVPAFETEYFAEYANSVMKIDVALEGEGVPNTNNYSPFEKYREYYNMTFNVPYKKKVKKAVSKLAQRIGADQGSIENKVRAIEHYMKSDFLITAVPSQQTLSEIVLSEVGNGADAMRLYMALLQDQGIDFEYGFVSDRYETYFSPDIESAYFLKNYFFYIPKVDKYLAPLDYSSRFGYVDYKWIPNNGYFMHHKEKPERLIIGSVRPIPSTEASDNVDSTVLIIDVNDDMDNVSISVERHISGYDAGEHQTYYELYNRAKKKEVHAQLLNFLHDRSEFELTEIIGVETRTAFDVPIVIKGELTELNTPILEMAGKKRIFKLGRIFGEYIDVHELEKKKGDFIFANPFTTSTTVIINFPKEIKVSNEASVPIASNYKLHNDIQIESSFKNNGKQLVFHKREVYKKHRYSIDEKDAILAVFEFYMALSNIDLIIE